MGLNTVGNMADIVKTINEQKLEMWNEMLDGYKDLLADTECYYHLFPNSHRKSVDEYYKNDKSIIARAEALK